MTTFQGTASGELRGYSSFHTTGKERKIDENILVNSPGPLGQIALSVKASGLTRAAFYHETGWN